MRDYWFQDHRQSKPIDPATLEPTDLEKRIYDVLKEKTSENGYMIGHDIAEALSLQRTPALYEAIYRLRDQGLVTETPKGSEWFRVKRNKPRREIDGFTMICFCDVCGMEIYRHEHIKMKTEKLLQLLKEQKSWAFTKHKRRVKHTGGAPSEWWINERWGDEKWGIPGKEPRGENDCPASHFAEIAGVLPEPWH